MSNKAFDPYRDWLGITDANRPVDHYQLLRLKRFEDDSAQIREHFHKLSAHLRKQLAGKAAPVAQTVLGELTRAMLCLTDAHRKSEYDHSLGRSVHVDVRNKSFDEVLLARRIVDVAQLEKAKKLVAVTGIELHDAIVQQKFASAEQVTQIRAEALGVAFVDMADVQVDPLLIAKLPAVFARQHSCVPIQQDGEQVVVASVNPFQDVVEEEMRLRFGAPVRLVLCTPVKLHELVQQNYSRETAVAEMSNRPVAKAGEAKSSAPVESPEEAAARRKQKQQITLVSGFFGFSAIVILGNVILGWGALATYGLGALVGLIAAGVAHVMNR